MKKITRRYKSHRDFKRKRDMENDAPTKKSDKTKWDLFFQRSVQLAQILLAIVACFTVIPLYQNAILEEAVAKKEVELVKFQTEISQKEIELEKFKTEMSQKEIELEKFQTEISQKEIDLEKFKTEISQKEIELEKFKTEISQKEIELEKFQTEISQKEIDLEKFKTEISQKEKKIRNLEAHSNVQYKDLRRRIIEEILFVTALRCSSVGARDELNNPYHCIKDGANQINDSKALSSTDKRKIIARIESLEPIITEKYNKVLAQSKDTHLLFELGKKENSTDISDDGSREQSKTEGIYWNNANDSEKKLYISFGLIRLTSNFDKDILAMLEEVTQF